MQGEKKDSKDRIAFDVGELWSHTYVDVYRTGGDLSFQASLTYV